MTVKSKEFKRVMLRNGSYDFEANKVVRHLRDARRPGGKYSYKAILELNKQGYSFTFYLNGEVTWEKVQP